MGMLDAYYNTVTKALIDKIDAKKLGAFKASRWAEMNSVGSVMSYAGVGAGVGAAYGLISSDTSVLGGAMKGAALGVGAHAGMSAYRFDKGMRNFEKGIMANVKGKRTLGSDSHLGFDGESPSVSDLAGRMSRLDPGNVKTGDLDKVFGNSKNDYQYIDGHHRMMSHPLMKDTYNKAVGEYAGQMDKFRASTDKWDNLTDAESPLRSFFGGAKGDGDGLMDWQPFAKKKTSSP